MCSDRRQNIGGQENFSHAKDRCGRAGFDDARTYRVGTLKKTKWSKRQPHIPTKEAGLSSGCAGVGFGRRSVDFGALGGPQPSSRLSAPSTVKVAMLGYVFLAGVPVPKHSCFAQPLMASARPAATSKREQTRMLTTPSHRPNMLPGRGFDARIHRFSGRFCLPDVNLQHPL
jgi:hypothetical protein